MNQNLLTASNALEDEALLSKAIAETLKILHTASYGYPQSDLDLRDIHEALWLICKISKYHSEKLLKISEDIFSALREQGAYSSSNAPV